MQVLMKKNIELLPIEKNPNDCDLIFIGTLVWAWTYAPPFRTFFKDYDLSGKKIALWCCSGGGAGKTLHKLKSSIKNAEFIGEISFIEPLKKE